MVLKMHLIPLRQELLLLINMQRIVGYIGGTAFVLLAWWALAVCINSPALPDPWKTFQEVGANAETLWPQFLVSVERLVQGLIIGALIGAPLGLISGMCPRIDALVAPVLYILYPVPKIVFLPLMFVFFGLGSEAKVILIVIAVVFQMMVTMRDAAKQVPRGTIDAMRSLGGSGRLVFAHVVVPATMPYFFSGLRVITGTAVAILFIAESMAGSTGLGYYIMHSWSMLEYARMFAGIVAMGFAGVMLYELFDFAERHTSG